MLPKKPVEIIKQTATELSMSEGSVDRAVTFFWQEIRRSLVEMRYTAIHVPSLGKFTAREPVLKYAVERCEKYLENNNPMTFRQALYKKEVETRLEGIRRLQSIFEQEKLRKSEVKSRRNGQIAETGMEKPEADS